jgi:GNAT superfamily N-acetyltransferase
LYDNWAKVYRAATPDVVIRTDLRIERIDRAHAAAFAEISCTAFGMPAVMQPWLAAGVGRPGWTHYLAFDGETPAAGGALFVKGDVGWLGIASTLPAYRRRGAQGALIARRIRDAAESGCRWVVTETGEDTPEHPNPSYHNMLRTGLVLAYQRPNYIAQT